MGLDYLSEVDFQPPMALRKKKSEEHHLQIHPRILWKLSADTGRHGPSTEKSFLLESALSTISHGKGLCCL